MLLSALSLRIKPIVVCVPGYAGALYIAFAKEQGYTKIALGHHREDIIETLFLNMFYGGKLKSMPAKLLSDDGENVVIRPLAYCAETDIKGLFRRKGLSNYSLHLMRVARQYAATGD